MKPLGGDEFLVLYGAADSDVGVTKIKVNIRSGTRAPTGVLDLADTLWNLQNANKSVAASNFSIPATVRTALNDRGVHS